MISLSSARVCLEGRQRKFKKVPKGTSEYQAAWIVSSDGDEEDCEDEEDLGAGLEVESLDSDDEAASTVRLEWYKRDSERKGEIEGKEEL